MTAEDRMLRALKRLLILSVILVVAAILVVILAAGLSKAFAHDPADPELTAWLMGLKQPDTGISCCGPSDHYFCDEGARGSQVICTINDDRDNKELQRIPVANGTVIEIPQHKINRDPNPSGRAVVFLSRERFVWCFVGISGS